MYLAAIPEIRVETTGNDVTFWLPARPLGKFRLVGLIPIGFSVLWFSKMGRMPLDTLHLFATGHHQVFDYFSLAFGALFVGAGCIPAGLGLFLMLGRCRVMWRDGRLTISETLGPLGWRRRLPKAAIRKFTVKTGASSNGQPVTSGP